MAFTKSRTPISSTSTLRALLRGTSACLLALFASGCDGGSAPPSGTAAGDQGQVDGILGEGGRPAATVFTPNGTPAVELHGQLSVSGTRLVDQNGNPVQLRGPSGMWLNWENDGFASDPATVRWMRDQWGASVIRAPMGISTSGTGDPDYLANPTEATRRVTAVAETAIDLGMYVIIDWHEEQADQHQAQAVEFFSQMAQTFGSTPNVLYETFNEPTTQAWSTVLKPYHEAVVAAIRQYDPDNVILLGTRSWSQRPDEAATDPVAGTNLMLTLHFYSCTHTQSFRAYGDAALAAGAAVFVTEWGATAADGGVMPKDGGTAQLCEAEGRRWHDWMNTHQISWCAWKLDNCTDLSCYFKSNTTLAQTQTPWTDDLLNGQASFVRGCMQGACP